MHDNKKNPQDNLPTDVIKYYNQPIQNPILRNNINNKTNSTHKKQSASSESISLNPKNNSKNQSLTSTNPPKHCLSPS